MFCPNCGNKLNGDEEFCPSCGRKIKELNVSNPEVSRQDNMQPIQQASAKSNVTMTEKFSNNSSKFIKPKINKMKAFASNHKKHIAIVCCCVLVIGIGVFLYANFFGFEKLSWNNDYSDSKLTYVTQSNIKLGVNFSDDTKIDKIKYFSTCGEIEANGLEVKWDLTEATGKCKITASYKLKKISKEYQLIPFNMTEEELTMDYKIDLESDEDLDLDNLTNKQEKEYNTNPLLSDSDMDGLDDDYEIKTSKTDPNKKDTDGDGLNDYDEIELGLDPLKIDSKGDGQKDGDRKLTYDYETDGLKLSISGQGNIASTIAEINSNTKISNKKGMIDNLYTFYTEGNIDEAVVTISYTDEDLARYGLNENNLSIYYYNVKESKYEKVETTVDKDNNTLTAKLKHFSNYVVGDESLVNEEETTQILFILDNSWSMYSNAQYKEITGKEYTGGLFGESQLDGFDEEGLRFTLTRDLVSRLSQKNYQMGLSEFRSDYANIVAIGTDVSSIKTALSLMNGKFITKLEGTNIGNALTSGIENFSKDSDNKFIVILTDGQDTSLSSKTEKIVEKAISSDVKICSIGFGDGSYNIELSNISNSTGCKFFSSSNVNGLTELFENIGVELDNDLVDIDNDGEVDGILVADSGFVVNRDGFSFRNYGTNLSSGHCFGMATFAELYYKKVLPLNVGSLTADDNSSYGYNLTNTYFKNYNNLYDYKLKTNALKYTFGYDIFGEEAPADFRGIKDEVLTINDNYKKEIENSGIYDIRVEKSKLSKEDKLKRWGVNFKSSESVLLNEDKMQKSSALNNDDKQMFNVIYASFIKQHTTTFYSSSTDFILWLRNVIGTETTGYTGASGFINIMKARLDDHDPVVISSTYYSSGLHAINAISLVQDIENPNYYYIGVYDNNYPGEKRYVDLECKKDKCVTKANSYYVNSNQPVRLTPSLEYDLAYFDK